MLLDIAPSSRHSPRHMGHGHRLRHASYSLPYQNHLDLAHPPSISPSSLQNSPGHDPIDAEWGGVADFLHRFSGLPPPPGAPHPMDGIWKVDAPPLPATLHPALCPPIFLPVLADLFASSLRSQDWAEQIPLSEVPARGQQLAPWIEGHIGLMVSGVPPHFVQGVNDLMDKNHIMHDQPGYSNPRILVGDQILQIDGRDAKHVDLETLRRMLAGPMASTVFISLARPSTGEVYRVEALRHGDEPLDPALRMHHAGGRRADPKS